MEEKIQIIFLSMDENLSSFIQMMYARKKEVMDH